MKTCIRCLEAKPKSEYHLRKDSPDGLRNNCRQCQNNKSKSYRSENKEAIDLLNRLWVLRNLERVAKTKAKYRAKNKAKCASASKVSRLKNPSKYASRVRARQAAKLNRTPAWLTEGDWIEINWCYQLAREKQTKTGVKMHVDHIIPLQGKNVSGLHVPWNLQVLPASENCKKFNKVAA